MDLDLEGLYEDDGEEYDTIPCQVSIIVVIFLIFLLIKFERPKTPHIHGHLFTSYYNVTLKMEIIKRIKI